MEFNWYKLVNYDDFIALDLPSQELEVSLEDIGLVTILVTLGVGVGILYDGVFLQVNLNNRNPFSFDGYSVIIDENNDIWLGVEIEE